MNAVEIRRVWQVGCAVAAAAALAGCGSATPAAAGPAAADAQADAPVTLTGDGVGDGAAGDTVGAKDGAAAACSATSSGVACDDGDLCTTDDSCVAGSCTGKALDCADGVTCTDDSCDKAKGCLHKLPGCIIGGLCISAGDLSPTDICRRCQPALSTSEWTVDTKNNCDDGDPCTQFDSCKSSGACEGSAMACDDGSPCTLDACTAADGCTHEASGTAPCDDGDPCQSDDACANGKCVAGKTALVCDDKNLCTKDFCDAKTGCQASDDPSACDDKEGCTTDSCDAKSGCKHTNLQIGAACSSGNLCETGATCSSQFQCKGGSPVFCDDKNVCTNDFCKPDKGCIHAINTLSCNDGESCTTPDLCTGGQCIGVKTLGCKKCSGIFSDFNAKLTVFQIGASGKPGQGLNVDGDTKTCAPGGNCSDGVDNAASVLGFVVNQPLIDSINNGQFTFLAELSGFKGEGQTFTLNLYYASMDWSSKNVNCNPQKDVCKWLVSQSAFTAGCTPKFTFPDAVISGGVLTAGGPSKLFAMDADIFGAKNATLYVKGARVEAKVTFAPGGKSIESIDGALGGAVPSPVVVDIINAMNDSVFSGIGGKANALALVQTLLEVDIDTDGDGNNDASSIGLRFSAIGAQIVGTEN